jgi:Cu/Ag efflux protein CusF
MHHRRSSFVRLAAPALLAALSLPSALIALPLAAALVPSNAQAKVVQAQASGQVVRVDAGAGKIAIRHGAIRKLELPAMTLVYHADPALLTGIAAGDTVDFTAERVGGQYRIVELEKD